MLSPDVPNNDSLLNSAGVPVRNTGSVVELSRTPLQLVWRITDDAFARYVVHCTARYHKIVSFSQSIPESFSLSLNSLNRQGGIRTTANIPAATKRQTSRVSRHYGSRHSTSNRHRPFFPVGHRFRVCQRPRSSLRRRGICRRFSGRAYVNDRGGCRPLTSYASRTAPRNR